jgi:Peptidase M1 N-terminal domain
MRYLPALLLFVTTTLTTTAPALSTASAAERLPAIAKPEHYRLWFEPDLQTDTFAGRTTIRVQLAAATSEIRLHAAEITFDKVRIAAGEQTQDATVALHSSRKRRR